MQHYSNFVTPPDFVNDEFHTVLLIDLDWVHVDELSIWCKTAPVNLNIYIYQDIMLNEAWLADAINRANTIIMNTDGSAVDHIKNQLIKASNVWYYGDKKFLGNQQKIDNPLDWFVRNYGHG